MSIANVTLNDTFSEWVVKTNQLIVQSENNYTLSVSSFNAVNAASFTAANIAADILVANSVFNNVIINAIETSGNLANIVANTESVLSVAIEAANSAAYNLISTIEYTTDLANVIIANEASNIANLVLANTDVLTTIYDYANVTANATTSNIIYSNEYIDSVVTLLIDQGQLANTILANTEIIAGIYDSANATSEAFNANSNLGLAWSTANVAFEAAFDTANALSDLANTALANTDSYTLVINNLVITGNLILSGPDAVLDMLGE